MIAALSLLLSTGALATPVSPGGGGGSDTPGNSPGATAGWIGSVGDVSTATGNKATSIPLVSWTSRGGLPVSFSLTHNSQATYSNYNGIKWTYSYLEFVVDNGSTVTFYRDDGSVYNFTIIGSGPNYSAPPGIHDTLVKNGTGDLTITTKDQIAYRFAHDVSSEPHYSFLSSISDENANTITITYLSSASYAVYQIIDPTGRTITLAYDAYSRLSTIKDPLSRTWTLGYDVNSLACNLTSVTFPTVNSTTPKMVFAYGTHVSGSVHYDANDVISIEDLRGNTSTYTYTTDGLGSVATETTAKGNSTSFSYGTTATTISDPNSHTRVDTYDTTGRLTSVQDADGHTDTYTYDSDNNVLTHVDRNSKTWTYTYDTGNANQSAHGNRLSALDPRNAAAHLAAVSYTYTAHNRLQTVTKPSSIKATLAYDSHDNLTTVTESYTNTGGTSTTAATTTIAYPVSPAANYGLPVSKTDTNSHTTTYTFDTNGNLASVTTPLGKKTQWIYDALGFPTQRTDALNRVTTYTPDGWERLVDTKYPDSSHHTFGYDNNSNLTAFANGLSVTRSYDVDNRMTTESYNGAVELTNTYDASGQKGLRSTSVHGTQTVTYGYTDRNELFSVADNAGTSYYGYSNGLTYFTGYDAAGNLTNQTLANGSTVAMTYDADSVLSSLSNDRSGGQAASAFAYSYDADGRMSSGTDYTGSTPSALTWTYDGQSHLSGETRSGGYGPFHDSFTLDGVGNRTQQTNVFALDNFLYDADDRLYNYGNGGYTFGYNDNGDMTTATLNGYVSTLSYDYDDQLTGISSAAGTVTYGYDAIGRRVYRQDASGSTHSFIFDGSNLVGEYNDTTDTWDTEYTYGLSLLDKQGSGGTEFVFYDGLGDTYGLTTPTGQTLLGEVSDDFGQHFGPSGIMGVDDLSYKWRSASGYRWDGDGLWTGSSNEPIVEVGSRYYIPAMGVFITRDKDVLEPPYQYCYGEPVNLVDPTGHDPDGNPNNPEPTGTSKIICPPPSYTLNPPQNFGGTLILLDAGMFGSDEKKTLATLVGGLVGTAVAIKTNNKYAGVIAGAGAGYIFLKAEEHWDSIKNYLENDTDWSHFSPGLSPY